MATSGSLSTRQKRALVALLTSRTVSQAAHKAGVGERTLYRWLAEDELFGAELARQESAMLTLAVSGLASELCECFDVMAGIRDDVSETGSTRLAAVRLWCDLLLRLVELQNVLSRLDRLEERFYAER